MIDKNHQVFLNAASEAIDAHSLGRSFGFNKTSYNCPYCKRAKIIAEIYEHSNQKSLKEVDVSCPACSKKITLQL
jgi:transposase-like protein